MLGVIRLSRILRLNWQDVLHALFASVLGSVVSAVITCLQDGWPHEWEPCANAAMMGALIGGLSYLGKSLGTNSANQLFERERYLIPDPRGGMPTVGPRRPQRVL